MTLVGRIWVTPEARIDAAAVNIRKQKAKKKKAGAETRADQTRSHKGGPLGITSPDSLR